MHTLLWKCIEHNKSSLQHQQVNLISGGYEKVGINALNGNSALGTVGISAPLLTVRVSAVQT